MQTIVEYRELLDFPGYKIGNDGTILSCHERGIGKILGNKWNKLNSSPNKAGYLRVHLKLPDTNKRKKFCIHILVLLAFIGPKPSSLHQACHNDDIKTNIFLNNLRWDTPKENQQDSVRNGTKSRGETVATKLDTEKVIKIREDFANGVSAVELAERYNVRFQHIYRVVHRERWAHIP